MPPVKETVTGGFGKVLRKDVRNAGKVCDGAGDLYDTGVCAGAEPLAVNDFLQKVLTLGR